MFYTVIHKSGWQSDTWRVSRTFTAQPAAREFAADRKNSDPKSDWHNVKIISHRNPVSFYLKDDAYRFAGGITATT